MGWTLGKLLRDLRQAPVGASREHGPANRVRDRTILKWGQVSAVIDLGAAATGPVWSESCGELRDGAGPVRDRAGSFRTERDGSEIEAFRSETDRDEIGRAHV